MAEVTYKEAVNRALADALAADPDVFVFGEDIGAAGGVFKTTAGLQERFGRDRVLDTPISEQAILGLALGAATQGMRPVAELMFADFAGVAFDQIVNQLAKYRYMSNGQISVPVTIRLAQGIGGGFAAQHSQSVENWFLNVVGLKIVVPATPADAYGLLRAAIADEDPVLFFEHKGLLNDKGQLEDDPQPVEIGRAAVVRQGSDVTIVASQLMRARALEAAERLAAESISVEVIDPVTLVPMDIATIGAGLERTNNLVVVQESSAGGSWGATLIARLIGEYFDSFDSPPLLLAGDETPIPFAHQLEQAWPPSADRIVDAVRGLLGAAAPAAG
ncbi:MAG: alpha-ketoacid dehydrogenase subunit beta [Actinobacteria bacterium]|nr:alpha-ketoacid dehydrogenase subunit beta [Actinomycetota bacterium]